MSALRAGVIRSLPSGARTDQRKMQRILASRVVCFEEKIITSRVVCFDLCAQG